MRSFSQLYRTKHSVLPQSTRCRECIYNTDGARNALITAFTRSFLSVVYRRTFIAHTLALCANSYIWLELFIDDAWAVIRIHNFPWRAICSDALERDRRRKEIHQYWNIEYLKYWREFNFLNVECISHATVSFLLQNRS